jgi:hypothetical protein
MMKKNNLTRHQASISKNDLDYQIDFYRYSTFEQSLYFFQVFCQEVCLMKDAIVLRIIGLNSCHTIHIFLGFDLQQG